MLLAGVEIRDGVHYQVKSVGVELRGEGSKMAHWWNVGKLLIAVNNEIKGAKPRDARQLGKDIIWEAWNGLNSFSWNESYWIIQGNLASSAMTLLM